MMIYSAIAAAAIGIVVLVLARRAFDRTRAARIATRRDVERAEGEGMVFHPK
ncbi:MAG: hypothetical protein IPJ34_35935 [Myxococcales bacterium]|nr:hypothetical protein [Myxococcales bacterium]